MNLFKKYWWLLLVFIAITLIFLIKYEQIATETLEFTNTPYVAIGKVVLKLVVIGALLDQFISVFFPEKEENKVKRSLAQISLKHNKEQQKRRREEIFQMKLNSSGDFLYEKEINDDSKIKQSTHLIQTAELELLKLNTERTGFIRIVAFTFSLVLAVSGITIIRDFLINPNIESINIKIIYFLDIILSAALISGGTSGINQFFNIVKNSLKNQGVNQ